MIYSSKPSSNYPNLPAEVNLYISLLMSFFSQYRIHRRVNSAPVFCGFPKCCCCAAAARGDGVAPLLITETCLIHCKIVHQSFQGCYAALVLYPHPHGGILDEKCFRKREIFSLSILVVKKINLSVAGNNFSVLS